MNTLNASALGYAGAIIASACMLTLGLLANAGLYTEAAAQMAKWHMFFSLSPVGIITGTIEAAIITFVILYVFAVVYNQFLPSKQ